MIDVIFDCDVGHDDAIALMVALAHPEKINLLGVTTVAGNQTLEKVTNNTLKLLDWLGFSVPVSAGYAKPVVYDAEPAPDAHGEGGMDGPMLPPATSKVTGEHAIDFMRRTLEAAEKPVTIVAVGPLTNVGMLLYTWPHLKEKIEKIAIMGGGIYEGNTQAKSEFNIYHDPHAARMVFRSGVPVVMSGLEVCYSGGILLSEYPEFAKGGKASKLAFDLLDFYSGYARRLGWDRTAIFDMTTVAQLLHPELFESGNWPVDVELAGEFCRGMTVVDMREPKNEAAVNCQVLTRVKDREAFIGILRHSLKVLDARDAGA